MGPRATAAVVLAATAGAFLAAAASFPGNSVVEQVSGIPAIGQITRIVSTASSMADEAVNQLVAMLAARSSQIRDAAASAIGSSVAAAVSQTHEVLDSELEKRLGQVAAMASQMVERVAIDKDMPLAVQRIVRQSISRITPRLRAAVGARLRRGLRTGLLGPLSRSPSPPRVKPETFISEYVFPGAGIPSDDAGLALSAAPASTPHEQANSSPLRPRASESLETQYERAGAGMRLVSGFSPAPRWLRQMTLQEATSQIDEQAPYPRMDDPKQLALTDQVPSSLSGSSPASTPAFAHIDSASSIHSTASSTAATQTSESPSPLTDASSNARMETAAGEASRYEGAGCWSGVRRACRALCGSTRGRARNPPLWHRLSLAWLELRAGVLYTLNPADKSVWTCAKDGEWWSLNALGTVPVVGQAWWLLLFAMHDRGDEGRLTDFVVSFEAASLATVGIYSLLSGAGSLLACSAWFDGRVPCDDAALPTRRWLLSAALQHATAWTARFAATPMGLAGPLLPGSSSSGAEWALPEGEGALPVETGLTCPACAVYGPRASALDALFFVVQVSLVWTAFALLPFSTRLRRRLPGQSSSSPEQPQPESVSAQSAPRTRSLLLQPWYGTTPRARGGELIRLFWYFSAVVVVCTATVISILAVGGINWRTLATAFWVRCAFGLLGAPFALFKLPVIGSLFLLRCDATGYDRFGRVVLRTS
jgi:hypothetical protein